MAFSVNWLHGRFGFADLSGDRLDKYFGRKVLSWWEVFDDKE